MEDAFLALGRGVRTVVRTPRLVVAAAVVGVVLAPVVTVLGGVSLVLSLLGIGPLLFRFGFGVLVKPVLFGGLVGLAAAALDGEVSASDFTDGLSEGRGVSLAGAYGVQEVAILVLGIAIAVLWFLARTAGETAGLGSDGLVGLVSAVSVLLGVGLLIAASVTLQFVDVAAVLDDASARDAIVRSIRLVRARPLEVAGYTALRLALVAVTVLPGVVLWIAADSLPGAPPVVGFAGWVPVVLLLPFGLAAAMTTHVAYYRRRTGRA